MFGVEVFGPGPTWVGPIRNFVVVTSLDKTPRTATAARLLSAVCWTAQSSEQGRASLIQRVRTRPLVGRRSLALSRHQSLTTPGVSVENVTCAHESVEACDTGRPTASGLTSG